MSNQPLKGEGFVLRAFPYMDNDLIVYVLSKEEGILHFFVRSARNSKKRFGGGVLDPLNFIKFTAQAPKASDTEGGLISLKEAELIKDFPKIKTSYKKITSAMELLKVVMHCQNAGEDLFNHLGNTLNHFSNAPDLERYFTHFVVRYLGMEGVLPDQIELNQMRNLPMASHLELDEVSVEDKSRETSIAKHFLRSYIGDKAKILWP